MKEEYSFEQRSFYTENATTSTESLQEMLKEKENYGPDNLRVINDILEERKYNPFVNEEPEVFMNNGLESYETIEAETEKYWICPSCKKFVGREFAVCWNCQAETPVNPKHPDKDALIKDQVSESYFNPVRKGFSLVIGGIVIGLLGLERDYFKMLHWGRFIIGGVIVISGIAFIISGLYPKINQDKRQK